MTRPLALAALIALAGCGQDAAQIGSEVTTGVTVARTLADLAAQYNTTAAALVAKGNLICGKIDGATGQLAETGLVAVASLAGAPAAVTSAAPGVVAAACPAGTVPGPLPASVPAAAVPVVATPGAAALPVAGA